MNEFFQQVQDWATVIGPNIYLQALAVALAFGFIGKIADVVLSRAIGQFVRRSKTDFDDRLIALLHRPVFISFVLIGLGLATQRIALPAAAEYFTLSVLKTIAIVVWYNVLRHLTELIATSAQRRRSSTLSQTGMLSLAQNVAEVVLFALTVYFLFLA